MSTTSERIMDPTIDNDWGRIAIMEVIEHWQENARSRGIWKQAKKLTRKLLWLLPESRVGEPVINPLDGSTVQRPKHPMWFGELRRECELLDDVTYRIFDRYCPVERVDGARLCVVCLGEGWVSDDRKGTRTCRYCSGHGVVDDLVCDSPSLPTPLPNEALGRGETGLISVGEVVS